jgi:hypothetical protein
MTQSIKRKDFLALTITFTTLGLAAACGDDDDDATSTGGTSGSGGKGSSGSGTGGKAGSGTGGKAGSGTGGKAGSGTGGTNNEAGQGGGLEGGTGNEAGGGGVPEGGVNAGGGGAGGAGGEGGVPVLGAQCDNIVRSQTATTAATVHDHIPTEAVAKAAFFTQVQLTINTANGATSFMLPLLNAHQHTVSLTGGEVNTLVKGGTVTKESDGATHTHTIKIECA